MALPPALSAATPAAEASGWSDATAACATLRPVAAGAAAAATGAVAAGRITPAAAASARRRIKPEPRAARVISERYQG